MTTRKAKAPGSNPEPSVTKVLASAGNPNDHLHSGTEIGDCPLTGQNAHYLTGVGYGEVVEGSVSQASDERGEAFELIDHHTHRLMCEAGLRRSVGLYLLLSEFSSFDKKAAMFIGYPVTLAVLAQRCGASTKTVRREIAQLEAAGFITIVPQRKTVSPGNSKKAGNIYVLNHRSMRGQFSKAIQYEVDTAQSEPQTQIPEAERKITADLPSHAYSIPSHAYSIRAAASGDAIEMVNRWIPATSSTTAEFTTTREQPLSHSQICHPTPPKSRSVVISSRDLDRDLFKQKSKKSLNPSKGKPATSSQITTLEQYLKGYKRPALELYGVENLSELSQDQANGLIQHTQSQNPEVTNRLNRVAIEQRERDDAQNQAREAANQAQQDYEAAQAYQSDLERLYGRSLSESEQDRRTQLKRAGLRHKAESQLKARGRELATLEADTTLEPGARLSMLLDLISR